jgi:hypothetical protein
MNIKARISFILIIAFILNTYMEENSFFLSHSHYCFITFLPLSWVQLLIKFGGLRQKLYDSILLFIFRYSTVLSYLIIKYHLLLFYFRIGSLHIGDLINKYMNLNIFILLLSLLLSRFHFGGYVILFSLIFIRLDLAVVSMCRFYRNHPDILHKNFPQMIPPHTRSMWSQAVKVIGEASSNPQVQTVAVAVAGALTWKALDVYDTIKQEGIAEADRLAEDARQKQAIEAEAIRQKEAIEAEATRHREALEAEASRHRETLDAETTRHKEALQAEASERQKDRQEENKRLAFDKMSSPDFDTLSDEQKRRIRDTAESGDINF